MIPECDICVKKFCYRMLPYVQKEWFAKRKTGYFPATVLLPGRKIIWGQTIFSFASSFLVGVRYAPGVGIICHHKTTQIILLTH